METLYGLTYQEVRELPLAVFVRYVITRSEGSWNSERIMGLLDQRGWETTSSCPRNFAGNMLSRLEEHGAAVKVRRGVYEVSPEEVHRVQLMCLRRVQASLSVDLYDKVADWSPNGDHILWA